MATNRKLNSKLKDTVVEDVKPESTVWTRYMESQRALFAEHNVPSGSRLVVAYVAGIVVSLAMYVPARVLLDLLVTAALVSTGSLVLSMAVWLVGVVLTTVGCLAVFSRTYAATLDFKVPASVHAGAAKVRGWFTRSSAVQGA